MSPYGMVISMSHTKIDTIKELLSHIDFVPIEGRFIWKDGCNTGKLAGSLIPSGYREICLRRNSIRFRAYEHQIVWYLHHKEISKHLHHINENLSDNRIENLEIAWKEIDTCNKPIDERLYAEYILTKLTYNSENNYFTWNENRQKKTKGKRAGNLNYAGYWIIKFRFNRRCVHVLEHRLIWFMHHNELPDEIDHINGVRDDNRIDNLRAATRYQNAQNLNVHRAGKLWGVTWEKNSWRARFRHGDKLIHVGLFPTKFKAYRAVIKRAKELGIPFPNSN